MIDDVTSCLHLSSAHVVAMSSELAVQSAVTKKIKKIVTALANSLCT